MSLPRGATFESELKRLLAKAKLPLNPRDVIAKKFRLKYQFGAMRGSHHFILVGTILAIEISDEGGLELIVSNPRLHGRKLLGIMFNEDKGTWSAYIQAELSEADHKHLSRLSMKERERYLDNFINNRFYDGEFKLI